MTSISEAASDVLAKHWDGRLPVDPVAIARRMGVNVLRHTFEDETVCDTGLVDGTRTIRVAKNVEGTRLRWAVAHALGHIVLHAHQLRELPNAAQAGS